MASEKVTSTDDTGVSRGSGETGTIVAAGADSSTNTSKKLLLDTLPAASVARAGSLCVPTAFSVSALLKVEPVTVASPKSVPMLVSVNCTTNPVSPRAPLNVRFRVFVSPSVADTPASGATARLFGAAGGVVSINQLREI